MQNRAAAWIVGSVSLLLIVGCTGGDGSGGGNDIVEKPKVVPGQCYACTGTGKVASFGVDGRDPDSKTSGAAGNAHYMERPTNADGTPMTASQFRSGGGDVPGMKQVDCTYCGGTGKTEVGAELPESADDAGRNAAIQGGTGGPGGGN